MNTTRPRTLLFTLLFVPLLTCAADYPNGAAAGHERVFVSHAGLHLFVPERSDPVRSELVGEATFEPLLTGRLVLVPTGEGLFAYERAGFGLEWVLYDAQRLFPAVVDGPAAYVAGRDGYLRRLSVALGKELWRVRPGEGWIYPPAVARDLLVVAGQDGMLRGLKASSGRTVWELALGQEPVYRPVATPNGAVVVTTFAGDVIAVDPREGTPSWRRRLAIASYSPTVAGSRLLLPGWDGRLRALDAASGELLWESDLGGRPLPHLAVRDDRALALTDDRYHLIALDSGRPLAADRLAGEPVAARWQGADRIELFTVRRNGTPPQRVSLDVSAITRPAEEKNR